MGSESRNLATSRGVNESLRTGPKTVDRLFIEGAEKQNPTLGLASLGFEPLYSDAERDVAHA